MNVSWPLIDKHLSEESTAKVRAFQEWATRNPSRQDLQDLLAHVPVALFPSDPIQQENQLPLAERCWRATQRADYRTVYAAALDNPRKGVQLLEQHALQLSSYQAAIDRLSRLEAKARQIANVTEFIAYVPVSSAWRLIGFDGWHVMMPSLGLRRIVQHEISALIKGQYCRSLSAFLALGNEEKVVVYNEQSDDAQVQDLIVEHQKCVIDVAHVQLRLARTYRLWIALQLWNQGASQPQ